MPVIDRVLDFILGDAAGSAPAEAWHAAKRSLLDTIGVAVAGITTDSSRIACDVAAELWPAGPTSSTLLFDGRQTSAAGAAFAGAQTIDSIDAHDGFKPAKGHAGVAVLPALLAVAEAEGDQIDGAALLDSFVVGYEIACRTAIAQHRTCLDYHSSGSWNALGAAAVAARIMKLDRGMTHEALGIAEYNGPRSQIMRVVDFPSMVKDGSGWGAMAGVTAAYLARRHFTGSPALTIERPEVADVWNDLGERWRITEQYFKRWPICRWAQPAVKAALDLAIAHDFQHGDVESVIIHTFHEACRLAGHAPTTTDEAQYSIAFPTACAIVRGEVGVDEIAGSGLTDSRILELAGRIRFVEVPEFNAVFPARRLAKLTVQLRSGRIVESDVVDPPGDPEFPISDQEIVEKFFNLATPVIGHEATKEIPRAIGDLRVRGVDLPSLLQILRSTAPCRDREKTACS